MIASAKSYSSSRSSKKEADDSKVRSGEDWQQAAWDFFDLIGEYRQAPNIMGALLSRAKLVCEEKVDGVWVRTDNPAALAALDELYGGQEGQEEMLRQYGIHFTVAGEGWLVGPKAQDAETASAADWMVVAATKMAKSSGTWKVNGKPIESNGRTIIRLWRQHPADHKKADAPTRAALPVLSELLQLRKRVAAQIDSRLYGAGVWLLPSETEFTSRPITRNAGDPAGANETLVNDAQGLADMLFENGRIAVANPESAEAMLPLIGMVPGEYLGKSEKLSFASELDKQAPALRAESLLSVARTMDVPPEVLLGNAGSNHWNAWLSDENNVKIYGEPTLKIITGGLTTQWLHKALTDEVDDVRLFRIGADTSQMRLRPNRSKEAMELNQSLLLSDEAVLRENGFVEADLMSEEGIKVALLRKVASGSTTPELVAWALDHFGLAVPEITDNRPPAEARPAPSLAEHPVRELPESSANALHPLTFVAEQMVDRALQRAGNRLKQKLSLKDPEVNANRLYLSVTVNPGDVNSLLTDAWAAVREFDYGVNVAEFERALDLYTRSILSSGSAPTRAGISASLKLMDRRTVATINA